MRRVKILMGLGVVILALYVALLFYLRSWMETKALLAFGGAAAPLFMYWAAVCFWAAAREE